MNIAALTQAVCKELFQQDGKDNYPHSSTKIFTAIIYTLECIKCSPERSPLAYRHICACTNYSSLPAKKRRCKTPAGKTGTLKNLPSYARNPFRGSPFLEFDPCFY